MGTSQNQLERIEDLLTQLIKNVANIRTEVAEHIESIQTEMSELRADITEQFKKVNLRLDYQREHVTGLEEEFWILKNNG